MNKLTKLIFSGCIFILTTSLFSQGAEHKIVEILSNENVRINIGQDSGVKTGDYFQVFGKSEVIHPATGQLIVKENVYIGKLEVIEVEKTESICKVLEQKKYFQISDKVRKVSKGVDSAIQEERDTQFEFESPQKRDYAETIYSKKPDPTRDISAKKMWYEGPFLLKEGMVVFNFGLDLQFLLIDHQNIIYSGTTRYYIRWDNYFSFGSRIPFNISYGLSKNIQLKIEMPLQFISLENNPTFEYIYYDGSESDSYTYSEEGFGIGLSDIKLTGLYNLPKQNYNISIGTTYSIATDDGWRKLYDDEPIWDADDNHRYFQLPMSNGYNTLSILGSIGIKQKNLLAFGEMKYNINGKRDDYEEITYYNSYNEIEDTITTVYQYNPTNNFEINLVGSFFISERTKLRSEINILNNFRPIDEDSDSDKRGMIILQPSIHRLMAETFIWSFEFFFPLKNEYEYDYYFGLTMGFTWIN